MSGGKVKTIDPNAISKSELHHHLISAVAPRPICFASTIDMEENVYFNKFRFFYVFS